MKMESRLNTALIFFTLSFLSISSVQAEQTVINNYGTQAPNNAQSQSPCNNATNYNQAQSSYGTNTPPGTYTIKHGDGSSETVYTTGDKKPYLVDNGCNNSTPIVQPYINVPSPYGPKKDHEVMPRR